MSDAAEIIKATAELLRPVWWPGVLAFSAWMLRHELRSLIGGITEMVVEYKGAKAHLKIKQELKVLSEKISLDKNQAETLKLKSHSEVNLRGEAKATADFSFSPINAKKQKEQAIALRTSIGNDLISLESLAAIAETLPQQAIEESWKTLETKISEAAKLFGMRPSEERSELREEVRFLALNIFNNQDLLFGVYAVGAVWQKVKKNPEAKVTGPEAQAIVRYCIAMLTDIGIKVDELIQRSASS